MKTPSLQITYRKGKPFAAYIYLAPKPKHESTRTKRIRPGVVVDFGPENQPRGIEVVSPSLISLQDLRDVCEELGLERPDASDFDFWANSC